MSKVIKFNDFLFEKVNFNNEKIDDVISKFNKNGMDVEKFKSYMLSDPDTKVNEDGVIINTGAYTNWFLYNQVYFRGSWEIPYDIFLTTVKADPTSIMKGESIGKVGDFTKWMLHQYSKVAPVFKKRWAEDIYRITDAITRLTANKATLGQSITIHPTEEGEQDRVIKNPKDINSYKSIKDLLDVVKSFQNKDEMNESKESEMRSQSEILLENDEVLIIIPRTMEASIYFGQNTDWCTASDSESHNRFEYYSKNDDLIIIIFKSNNDKYQFHFESVQFMNSDDEGINLKEFLTEHNIVQETILKFWDTRIRQHSDHLDKKRLTQYKYNIATVDTNGIYIKELIKENIIEIDTLPWGLVLNLAYSKAIDFSHLEKLKAEGLKFKDGHAILVYTGIEDKELLEFFDNDSKYGAEEILKNEHHWEYNSSFDLSDAIDGLDEKNTDHLKKLIVQAAITIEDEDGEEVIITSENIEDFDLQEILESEEGSTFVDEYLDSAYSRSFDDAYNGKIWNIYTSALVDKLGQMIWLQGDDRLYHSYVYNTKGDDGKTERRTAERSHNLGFQTSLKSLIDYIDKAVELDSVYITENYKIHDIIRFVLYEEGELIDVETDRVYISMNDAKSYFNEILSGELPDIKPKPKPKPDGQSELFGENEEVIKESRFIKSFNDFIKK